MGRIRITGYESQVKAPGPIANSSTPTPPVSSFGGASGAGLGDAAQGLRRASDVLMQRAETSEISDLNAFFAKTQADFTQRWQETVQQAEPGDNTIAEKFVEEYTKYVDKRRESLGTRAGQLYFEREAADMGSRFQQTAHAAQAQLAGEKARNDYVGVVTNLSSVLMKDPSAYAESMKRHDDSVNNLVALGLLPKNKAMELKQQYGPELTMSAIRGWAQIDPDMAAKKLKEEFSGVLSSDQIHQMQGEVRVAKHALETDAEQARLKAERAKKARWDQLNSGYMEKFASDKLQLSEVIKSDLPAFGEGSKNQWVSMLREAARRTHKTDPAVLRDIFGKITRGELTDENQLNEYVINGDIDMKEDLPFMRNELSGRKTAEGRIALDMRAKMLAIAEQAIAKKDAFGNTQEDGGAEFLKFQYEFMRSWDEQVKAGTQPWELADPKSPKYMGNRFLQYVKSSEDRMSGLADQLSGSKLNPFGPAALPEAPDAKRKPGESLRDYRKRRGF